METVRAAPHFSILHSILGFSKQLNCFDLKHQNNYPALLRDPNDPQTQPQRGVSISTLASPFITHLLDRSITGGFGE